MYLDKDAILNSYITITRNGSYSVNVYLSCEADKIKEANLKLFENGTELNVGTKNKYPSLNLVQILIPSDFEFDMKKNYSVKFDFGEGNVVESKLILWNLYDSPAFNNKYNYFCTLLTFSVCCSSVSISSTGMVRVCCHCYISLLLK